MDLPASVAALGEQLRGAEKITPDPALFCDAAVFAAERERIFVRPLIAVDHETRLSGDGHYFRCDAAPRSMILTRENEGRLHALRNVCIHAGYPVCEAEEGRAEGGQNGRLICPYHGWEFALDGRLTEPALSSRIDPARLRLASYPVSVRHGLILVDPSGSTEPSGARADDVPAWLAGARVTRRAGHNTNWNWKFLRHFLRSSPHLLFDGTVDSSVEFGPLSFMMVQGGRAALLRIVPKFAEQTALEVIEMEAGEEPEGAVSKTGPDALVDGLRNADTSLSWFDRRFADWYWSLMSAA